MTDPTPNPIPNPNPTNAHVPGQSDKVLIIQNDRRKQRINVKLRKRMHKGYSANEYFKVLNPQDYNDLAIFFEDLDLVIGAPVEKAFRKYKQNKGDGFPFY